MSARAGSSHPLVAGRLVRVVLLALLAALPLLSAAQAFPTVRLSQLPEPLRGLWERTKPEMNEASRCAAAFDGGDPEKMTLQCSVYMRVSTEAERRAMRYCEDKRDQLRIRNACAIVQE